MTDHPASDSPPAEGAAPTPPVAAAPPDDAGTPPASRFAALPMRRKLLFALLPAVLLFGATELILRLTGFHYEGDREMQLVMAGERKFWNAKIKTHPEVLYRFQPSQLPPAPRANGLYALNEADINELGYRDEPFSATKPTPETVRVLVYGDSVTYGVRMRPDQAYPAVLERLLAERGGAPIEVLNLGLPSYTSAQNLWDFEERGIAFEPDVLVLHVGVWNDYAATSNDLTDTQVRENLHTLRERRHFFGGLRLFQAGFKLADEVVDQWRDHVLDEDDDKEKKKKRKSRRFAAVRRVPVDDFEEITAAFLAHAERLDLPVVVVIPELNSPTHRSHGWLFRPYHDHLRALPRMHPDLVASGMLRLVDLPPIVQAAGGDALFLDNCHYSPQGCEIVARALVEPVAAAVAVRLAKGGAAANILAIR